MKNSILKKVVKFLSCAIAYSLLFSNVTSKIVYAEIVLFTALTATGEQNFDKILGTYDTDENVLNLTEVPLASTLDNTVKTSIARNYIGIVKKITFGENTTITNGSSYFCGGTGSEKTLPKNLEEVDFTNLNISDTPKDGTNQFYTSKMFGDCVYLKHVKFDTNSNFCNTNINNGNNKWTYMSYMFSGCKNLTTLENFESLNVKNIISMSNLFLNCSSLKEVDLSGWETRAAGVTVTNMFNGCSSLKKITVGAKTNLSDTTGSMFNGCTSLNEIVINGDGDDVGYIAQIPILGNTIGWIKEGGHTLYTTAIGKDNGGAGTYIPVTKTAGTYKDFGGNGLGYCINYTDNGDVYLIYPINITEEELDDYNSIRLFDKNGNEEILNDPSTVYTSVKFSDDSVLYASDVGTDYLLAVQIEGAEATTPDNAVRFQLVANN